MGRPESRTERLERCLAAADERPDSAVTHYNLGLAYQKAGRYLSAEKSYERAVELDPRLTEAWVNLGGVRLHNWDFEGCLKASQEAVRRRDDLLVAHYNLGQAYLYMNEPEDMVRCNRKVLELAPDHAAAHYFAAVGLLALGDLGAAERHNARAMELGYRPTPEFLKAMEKGLRTKAAGELSTTEIAGVEHPEKSKED